MSSKTNIKHSDFMNNVLFHVRLFDNQKGGAKNTEELWYF